MQKTSIFQGEVVDSTSPLISEQEAIQNAAFPLASGSYSYDPSMRQPVMNILPGWQGYSTSYNNNGYYPQAPLIGQAVGLGANPYMYNPYQANPALAMYYQQQQQVPQTNQIYIPPYNINGEYLPLAGYDEKIEELKKQYWLKEQETAVKNSSNTNYNQFGYNYYGNLYYQYNYNNSLRYEVNNIVNQMQEEAREARRQFNIRLSKLAHNYIGAEYDESKIEELYTGKTIENPYGDTPMELFQQNRFANLVPFDNSSYYQAYQAQVSAEYSAIIRPESNMRECFDNMGIIGAQYELEEESHRRKNLGTTYDTDGYKYFVRKKIAERNNILPQQQSRNVSNTDLRFMNQGTNQMGIYTGNPSKNGQLVATIPSFDASTGTLTLSCNFGSHAGQNYSVNQNEAKYEQDRQRFSQFLDSIPKSIYPLGPGGS